jgi:hypothetical protein
MNSDESVKLLARVDERTKLMQERIDDFIEQSQENCKRCFDDHETRLRCLERWQWKATGIASAVTGFCGVVAGLFAGKGGP